MAVRSAQAEWNGALIEGKGRMEFGSGAFEGPYSFSSRMEDGPGTNPEELIAAAHAGCFSMQLSGVLGASGHTPESIRTEAGVHFSKQGEGWAITRIELTTRARVPGIDEQAFQQAASMAKETCPVSVALSATEISLEATLET